MDLPPLPRKRPVVSDPGPLIPPSRPMTAEQIGEFRERLEAAVKNPGPLKVLSPELTDAGLLEAAAAALDRRYHGTRPE